MRNITKIVGKDLENLPLILDEYEQDLSTYADNLTIKGKTLDRALREQPTWAAYYSERAVELSSLTRYIEAQVKQLRGKLTMQYNENYNPKLSERMTDKYIDQDSGYIQLYTKLLEVRELLEKYEAVIEAFNKRGFALKDYTAALVHDVQGVTL